MLAYNLICDFITALACLTDLDIVLYKSKYLIFSFIGINNEHPSSFVDVAEGGLNVETDNLFDVEMLPLLLRL